MTFSNVQEYTKALDNLINKIDANKNKQFLLIRKLAWKFEAAQLLRQADHWIAFWDTCYTMHKSLDPNPYVKSWGYHPDEYPQWHYDALAGKNLRETLADLGCSFYLLDNK